MQLEESTAQFHRFSSGATTGQNLFKPRLKNIRQRQAPTAACELQQQSHTCSAIKQSASSYITSSLLPRQSEAVTSRSSWALYKDQTVVPSSQLHAVMCAIGAARAALIQGHQFSVDDECIWRLVQYECIWYASGITAQHNRRHASCHAHLCL